MHKRASHYLGWNEERETSFLSISLGLILLSVIDASLEWDRWKWPNGWRGDISITKRSSTLKKITRDTRIEITIVLFFTKGESALVRTLVANEQDIAGYRSMENVPSKFPIWSVDRKLRQ